MFISVAAMFTAIISANEGNEHYNMPLVSLAIICTWSARDDLSMQEHNEGLF